MENFIVANKLHIMNKPGFPATFMTENGQSNIDITLASESIFNKIDNWNVSTMYYKQSQSNHVLNKHREKQETGNNKDKRV